MDRGWPPPAARELPYCDRLIPRLRWPAGARPGCWRRDSRRRRIRRPRDHRREAPQGHGKDEVAVVDGARLFADHNQREARPGAARSPVGRRRRVERKPIWRRSRRSAHRTRGSRVANGTGINSRTCGKGLNRRGSHFDLARDGSPGTDAVDHERGATMTRDRGAGGHLRDFRLCPTPEAEARWTASSAMRFRPMHFAFFRRGSPARAHGRSIAGRQKQWGCIQSWDSTRIRALADNPNHPFNIMVGTLARNGADILLPPAIAARIAPTISGGRGADTSWAPTPSRVIPLACATVRDRGRY